MLISITLWHNQRTRIANLFRKWHLDRISHDTKIDVYARKVRYFGLNMCT